MPVGDVFVSRDSAVGSGGTVASSRINPATEERQNDSLSTKSIDGGSQRVQLDTNEGQGPDQACRFCRIQAYSANTAVVRVRIGTAVTDATTGVEIPTNPTLTPYSVSNLNLLYFYSADADAIVDIEYFD